MGKQISEALSPQRYDFLDLKLRASADRKLHLTHAQNRPARLSEWSIDDIADWCLTTTMPAEVSSWLRQQEVNGRVLESLCEADLVVMGMEPFGRRRQFLLCRKELLEGLGSEIKIRDVPSSRIASGIERGFDSFAKPSSKAATPASCWKESLADGFSSPIKDVSTPLRTLARRMADLSTSELVGSLRQTLSGNADCLSLVVEAGPLPRPKQPASMGTSMTPVVSAAPVLRSNVCPPQGIGVKATSDVSAANAYRSYDSPRSQASMPSRGGYSSPPRPRAVPILRSDLTLMSSSRSWLPQTSTALETTIRDEACSAWSSHRADHHAGSRPLVAAIASADIPSGRTLADLLEAKALLLGSAWAAASAEGSAAFREASESRRSANALRIREPSTDALHGHRGFRLGNDSRLERSCSVGRPMPVSARSLPFAGISVSHPPLLSARAVPTSRVPVLTTQSTAH